jgi:hypothetical protein
MLQVHLSFFHKFEKIYEKIFYLNEIEQEKRALLFWWGILGLIIFDLRNFSGSHESFAYADSCWVYFQNCRDYWPFVGLPQSYDFSNFLMLLGTLIIVNIYFLTRRKWVWAHLITLILMLFKFSLHFILKDTGWQNFEYFMQVPAFVFLLCQQKLKSVRITWSLLLFMSAQVKFHEAWAAGAYFTTLELGLPIFSSLLSSEFIPLISTAVIILEIWGSFALLAKSPQIRKLSFSLWVIFHLYSIALVQFHYPVRCFMVLLIAFSGIWNEQQNWNPYSYLKSYRLTLILFLVLIINLAPKAIPSDQKFTFEGLGFGFFMFDSNHQCLIQTESFNSAGESLGRRQRALLIAMNRCDPWHQLQMIRRECAKPEVARVSYIHDHSYNGSPFYRMVDEDDACHLEYKPFSRNRWIRDIRDNPPIVGYPYPNQAMGSRTQPRQSQGLPIISPEPVIKKPHTQVWLTENLSWIIPLYWFYWVLELLRITTLYLFPQLFNQKSLILKSESRQTKPK